MMSIIKKAQSYKEKENTIIKREKPIFPQTAEGRFFSLFAGMKHFEEKAYLCALNRIFGFKPKIALALISHFGSASEVFSLKDKDLEMVLGPYSGYGTNFRLASVENEAKELDKLAKENIYFVLSVPPLIDN